MLPYTVNMRAKFLAGLVAALSVTSVNAIATITTKGTTLTRLSQDYAVDPPLGSKFFTSDGNQWFVKGVAYQLLPADPLLDTAQCTLDAALMKQLGANAIRVYHVTSGDHSGCMSAFEAQGIYLFVDLDTFTSAITQTAPMWTQAQESAFEAVMDEFQAYDNTAGFFIGNEVLNDGTMSDVSPFISAAVRDLKAYRNAKGYRNIPIGYSHGMYDAAFRGLAASDRDSLQPTLPRFGPTSKTISSAATRAPTLTFSGSTRTSGAATRRT